MYQWFSILAFEFLSDVFRSTEYNGFRQTALKTPVQARARAVKRRATRL
jgi:hypothetical protein